MKKWISLILILAMLVPFTPAKATSEPAATPTIEEILNEYHDKAFEASVQGEDGAAATWSGRSGDSKTLEQETVEQLTTAGYAAYNVTSENYNTVADTLNINLAEMGLDPNGSYIVVIGSDVPSENANPNSRVAVPPVQEDFDGDYGSFEHVYNGTSYTLRYVTVTASINSNLGITSPVELLDEYDANDAYEDLSLPITIVSSIGKLSYIGTLYSLFSSIVPNDNLAQSESLTYRGATNWTVTYIQLKNPNTDEWELRSGFEYATLRYFITHTYHDYITDQYQQTSTSGTYDIIYSKYYNDRTAINDWAVIAYLEHAKLLDKITYVSYTFGNKKLITHYRWEEYASYEPLQ